MADLVWDTFTTDELSPKAAAAYDTYKAAYKQAQKLREAFEAAVSDDVGPLPDGKALKFGYRFGKISVAVGDADPVKAPKAAPKKLSADWLKTQV